MKIEINIDQNKVLNYISPFISKLKSVVSKENKINHTSDMMTAFYLCAILFAFMHFIFLISDKFSLVNYGIYFIFKILFFCCVLYTITDSLRIKVNIFLMWFTTALSSLFAVKLIGFIVWYFIF